VCMRELYEFSIRARKGHMMLNIMRIATLNTRVNHQTFVGCLPPVQHKRRK
jgi:hypothetical protein